MAEAPPDWIVPAWPVPGRVRALITTRSRGTSSGPYATMNLGLRVGDDPRRVQANRESLRRFLPAEPIWLNQVHGARVVDAARITAPFDADAAVARTAGCICAVMIADCLPVLLADRAASVVAAAHAGWRGLAAGIIENTVRQMAVAPAELVCFLGPAIGPSAFEVGADVRDAFLARDAAATAAFVPHGPGKWLADLFLLARQRLNQAGVTDIHGGSLCTWSDPKRFYSHRRDKVTGRMAALIWLSY